MTTAEAERGVDEVTPGEAYNLLERTPGAVLADVRTRAEWAYVGLPDLTGIGGRLVTVEWISFPAMRPNPAFTAELVEACGGDLPDRLFFICRSGARSMAAAGLVAAAAADAGRPVRCTNVAEGFEGDLDAAGHRGTVNGWKVAGLPWRQG